MMIEAFFKENGEKIQLTKILIEPDGQILAVEDIDKELYGRHLIDVMITL